MGEDRCCFNKNQLNFFRVCHLSTDVLPCELREIFIQQWNVLHSRQYGDWCNISKNGQDFFALESNLNKRRNREMLNQMQIGNIELWDCTMLFYALLYSTSVGGRLDDNIRNHVNNLREFRNQSFAHVNKGEVSSSDFQMILNKILQAFLGLRRNITAVKKVQNLNSFSTEEVYELQEKLEQERIAQSELDKRISILEDRMLNLERKTYADNEEDCDYSNIRNVSLEKNTSVAPFVILPIKPNHPVVQRHQVNEVTKTLQDLKTVHDDKITSVFMIGEPLSGKTECARQIGLIISKENAIVATIQGDSFQKFASSLKQLAQRLGFRQINFPSLHKASITSQVEIISLFVKERLCELSSWLVILDGVLEETKKCLGYLPQPGDVGTGQIIVTTQDRSLITNNSCSVPVVLDRMTSSESLQLISLICGNIPQNQAEFVAERLEHQPAFFVSAANRVKLLSAKRRKSLVDTWTEVIENTKKWYKEDEWPYYISALDESTRSKLFYVIELVMKRSIVIKECFHLLVLAKGSYLPLDFLTRFLAIQLNMTERNVELILRDSPLLRVRGNNIGINAIIYRLLCDYFVPAVRSDHKGMIDRLRGLCHFSVTNTHDVVCSKVLKLISPKVTQYLVQLDLCVPKFKEQRSLHHELGKAFLCVLVDYGSAVRCFTKAISIFEGSNDIMHPEYAQLLNSLGNVLRLTGSMEDACKYLSKSLKLLNAILRGNVTEDVASCLSSLGLVFLSQGDLDRARELHYRALAIREQLHGDDHITTATSLNNIGGVYHERGDLAKAKEFYWKALEIKGRHYGWDFPHMANSFNNIAEITHEEGDLQGAIPIHKRALKIRKNLHGDDHPDVAVSLNNIAIIHHKLRELSAARKYHTKALGIRKKVYGEEHMEVASSLSSLGEVYFDEGDLAAAEDCHLQALRIRQRHSVTSYHPEIITSLHNLMVLYIADQKITTATAYAYEIFKGCQKLYGMRDGRTVDAFRKLTELSKRESQGQTFDMSLVHAVHEHVERLSCL